MKSNFPSIAAQTWKQLRRFPTSDALADAVMLQGVLELIRKPFAFAKFFSSLDKLTDKQRHGNFFILPLSVFLQVSGLFWQSNLSLRLRRNEKKAWRTAIIHALLTVLCCPLMLLLHLYLKNGPREMSEEGQQWMTEEQRAKYKADLEKAREEPWKPILTPIEIGFLAISFCLALNVLVRALQKSTRDRFNPKKL